MCAVSAVVDSYRDRWPYPPLVPKDMFPKFEFEVKEALEQDEKDGQSDCSDSAKLAWRAELDEMIKKAIG